jgi:hypothetical protein
LEVVVFPDLETALRTATRRALHLEMRDLYALTPGYEAWLARRPYDRTEVDARWRDVLAPLVSHGGTIRRLRIVSEPLSEYVRYEYAVTPSNLAAGEQVRWLPRHDASDLALPGNDFWLIDDILLFNLTAGDGEWLGVQPNDDSQVMEFCATAFEAAWKRGVDHSDYHPA